MRTTDGEIVGAGDGEIVHLAGGEIVRASDGEIGDGIAATAGSSAVEFVRARAAGDRQRRAYDQGRPPPHGPMSTTSLRAGASTNVKTAAAR